MRRIMTASAIAGLDMQDLILATSLQTLVIRADMRAPL